MMLEPPLDTAGNVIPHDHPEIFNDDYLIRGIPELHVKNGRVSSGAFRSSSKERDPHRGMSIDIAKIPSGKDYQSDGYVGAVKFLAEIPRGSGLLVGSNPLEDNIAHGELWRVDDGPKPISSGQTKLIHKSCEWHVEIENTQIRK